MPYTGPGDDKLPSNVQELPEDKRAIWVNVFNSALAKCEEEGGEDCEARAFAQANGVAMKESANDALAEAATLKAKALALVRDMASLLEERTLPESVRKEIEDVRAALRRTWADLEADGAENAEEAKAAEAKAAEANKTVDGEAVPASSFLVVEDPDMPSTFHLQVRGADGKPDHRLMGAAYAALTVGYRGNKYEGPGKAEALRKLRALYDAEEMAWPGDRAEEADVPEDELITETLGESAEGVELLSEGAVQDSGAGPLTLKVQIIEPGWGNARDGHFYPADVVRRDAPKFKGAKMYETDHRPGEKSTRTWVSTLRDIIGYSETGAPIFDAVAHDPNFAQRMRNLAATKDADGQPMIRKMACSILANGTARKGQVDGKAGRIVEAITDVESVDWVTRAGAGGRALAIMSEAQDGVDSPRTEPERNDDMPEVEEQKPAAESEPVQEQEQPKAESQPERLAEVDVKAVLAEAQCNEAIKERLAKGEYANADALKAAIVAEVEYVKRVTGSGRVTDMGEAAKPKAQKVTLAEVEERTRAVNQKWGFGPVRKIETKEEVK